MHILLKILVLLLLATPVLAQQASVLEAEASKTDDPSQKMELLYKASEMYLLNNSFRRASETAHAAYLIAQNEGNYVMASRAAFNNAEGYARANAFSDAKIRFNRGKEAAVLANDVDYAVKCLGKMSDMARKQNASTEVALFNRQAQELLKAAAQAKSTAASSVTKASTPVNAAEMAALRAQYQKEKDLLVAERNQLAANITSLQKERDQLYQQTAQLNNQTKTLTQQTELAQQVISVQGKQLNTVAGQKTEAERIVQRKQALLEALKSEISLDSIVRAQDAQEQEIKLQRSNNIRNVLALALCFTIVIVGLIYKRFLENKKQRRNLQAKNAMIEEARERSDELLLNILPPPIAAELKAQGVAKAHRYESASVLFTDFKSFTKISEQLSPEQLVAELDAYFRAFDFIVKQYKLEKIKTIGDAYMCASGLSDRLSSPFNIVKAALEIQEYLSDIKAEKIKKGEPYFEARVGVHTGPVVAGVVGVNKFAYDIWGDTVNIASRLQENGEPGHVNISEATYLEIKYHFHCRYRGKLHAKNKGQIDMYYVDGPVKS